MKRTYEIRPRPDDLGGGWKLTLIEDGKDVGGGVFPLPKDDPQAGMSWWNALSEDRRAHWMMMADSAMPVAARHACLLAKAYNDAMDEGESWSGSGL